MTAPTFLDRLLNRDPLAGLLADYERVLNQRAVGGWDDTDPDDPDDLRRLCRRVASLIRRYDPRPRRIAVRLVGSAGGRVRLVITLDMPAKVALTAVRADTRWTCSRPAPEDRP